MSFIKEFIAFLENEKQYSDLTIKAYLDDLNDFKDYCQRNQIDGLKVDERNCRQYISTLTTEKKLKRRSIARHLSSLKGFYDYLVNNKVIKTNPFQAITIKSKEFRLPEFFYEPEIQKVINAAKGTTPLDYRNHCLVELLYATGMRVSECRDIELSKINFDNGSILVTGKGKKDRYVYFGEYAKEALQTYLEKGRATLMQKYQKQHSFLFVNRLGDPITSGGIEYVLNSLIKKASLNYNIHPHKFRHSFATHMLNEGADMRVVQEMLGHSNLSSTQIYTHVSKEKLKSDYNQFFPRAKR